KPYAVQSGGVVRWRPQYGVLGVERGGWNKVQTVLIFVKLFIKKKLVAPRRRQRRTQNCLK
ncbi:MAG TPA: hypothetical protein PKA53_07740, partial [Sphingobacterium sp.]|nr:hypothetical protein [Sphingobacterium sp.]